MVWCVYVCVCVRVRVRVRVCGVCVRVLRVGQAVAHPADLWESFVTPNQKAVA